jgi:deoxycytidylate deaminase
MRKLKIDNRVCAKQTTVAIIENHGKYWIGSNWCGHPQESCPRKDLPTGVGYEKCKDICLQNAHAEIDACNKAGDGAFGGTLYLIGHTYCCEPCKARMKDAGIEKVVIGELPKGVSYEIEKKNVFEKLMDTGLVKGIHPTGTARGM